MGGTATQIGTGTGSDTFTLTGSTLPGFAGSATSQRYRRTHVPPGKVGGGAETAANHAGIAVGETVVVEVVGTEVPTNV